MRERSGWRSLVPSRVFLSRSWATVTDDPPEYWLSSARRLSVAVFSAWVSVVSGMTTRAAKSKVMIEKRAPGISSWILAMSSR